MPYGVKRGVRAPGQFGAVDIFGLALAGSAGIIAALTTDYQQKGEASALYTINQWAVSLARMVGLGDVPLWAVMGGLIVAGAASVFYFQPITRQGAFAQGFGLLAVLMTTVPSDLAGGLQAVGQDGLFELEPVAVNARSIEAKLHNAALVAPVRGQASEARVYTVQDTRSAAKYEVHIAIRFPDGVPTNLDAMIRQGSIRGRLHNEDTGATYNLFRSAGGSFDRTSDSLIIHAGVPARAETATLWIRIECDGYAIEEQSATANLGGALDWRIDLQTSGTPLFIQRLGRSYWF